MEFLIKSIEPKNKYVVNKFYPAAVGRECDVIDLQVGWTGRLLVDMAYDPGHPHRFYTTPVKKLVTPDDGSIVFETENSVYTLVPMDLNRKD